MTIPVQWFCAQIGAREHYAIPRVLRRNKRLARLYTDFWAGPTTRKLAVGPLRALAGRFHPELEGRQGRASDQRRSTLCAWNLRALGWERLLRRKQKLPDGGIYKGFIEVGRRFALRVREDLKRRQVPSGTIFYAYDTGALEVFEWGRDHGIKCILNQMDPNRVEVDLVRAEEQLWPGWALQPLRVPEAYFVRREQEWALADRIVVNSEFSRRALLQQNVPPEKLVVIPLCYENTAVQGQGLKPAARPSEGPLRVLFFGQVILRKGIQYLVGAARLLEKENIHFDVVGPLGISREAVAGAPKNMTFHGRVNRDQAVSWYQNCDVFVLPTLSDGFALTQLEAMAQGLPVVATPCCGDVVSDGVDGLVVLPREAGGLAAAFRKYLTEPDLLRRHAEAALAKSRRFTLEHLAENLIKLEGSLTVSPDML